MSTGNRPAAEKSAKRNKRLSLNKKTSRDLSLSGRGPAGGLSPNTVRPIIMGDSFIVRGG